MKTKLLFFFAFLITLSFTTDPLFAAEDSLDNGIVVCLSTDTELIPIALDTIEGPSDLSSTYIKSLIGVLSFDIDHNGLTQIVKKGKNAYSLRIEISNHVLSASLTASAKGTVKKASPITLTGTLSEDRKAIHQLSDFVHKSISGKEGIATTRILYTIKTPNKDPSYKAQWVSEVWESDYDGANARQITHEGRYCVTPVYLTPKPGFAPGSFFYVSYSIGQPKIYVAQLKTGKGYRLTSLRGNQLMPTASRQRDFTAFICDLGGNPDLFLLGFDPEIGAVGKPRQLYATAKGTQGSPCFSPNGKQIAFVSNKDGSPRIYVMDIPPEELEAKDMKPILISKRSKESTSPTWSADGTKLAYSAMTNGTRQIWIYDFQSKKEEQLTCGPGNKENPSWAPNSLHLVFNNDKDSELYMVNLHQKDAVKVSVGSGEKRFPCWEPKGSSK